MADSELEAAQAAFANMNEHLGLQALVKARPATRFYAGIFGGRIELAFGNERRSGNPEAPQVIALDYFTAISMDTEMAKLIRDFLTDVLENGSGEQA